MTVGTIIDNIIHRIFGPSPIPPVDLAAILDGKAELLGEHGLDWRNSIVDLLKVLEIDSGKKNRTRLAKELGYDGRDDSAERNIWLHEQVMLRLAEQGGVFDESV